MFKRFMLLAVAATMMCLGAQAQKFGYVNTSEIFNVMPRIQEPAGRLPEEDDRL